MDDSFSFDAGTAEVVAAELAGDSRQRADGKLHIDRSKVGIRPAERQVGSYCVWIRGALLVLSLSHTHTYTHMCNMFP